MSTMDYTRNDPITALCDLAEASGERFQAIELDATYGTTVRFWADLGAIEPSAPIRTLTCRACDGDHPVTVEFDAATRRHSCFCPKAGLVTVDDAHLVALRFNPGWLVEWLIRELPISPPVRLQEFVQNRAWYLGDAMCGDTRVTVVFARQVFSQVPLDRLATGLRTIHPADKGLVITTSQDVVRHIALPNGYEFLDLREIMRATADGLTLDRTRLGSWIGGMSATTGKGAPSRSGRPSPKARILQIYNTRREQGLPFVSDLAEAKGILAVWPQWAPDQKPPHVSTVRRHVSRLRKAAATP
jgi:hypothetical protein